MTLPKVIAMVLLVSLMFGAGLQASRSGLMLITRNAMLLIGALVANFVVVPLVALAVVRLFHVNDAVASGILLMAIAPGVPFVILAGGSKKGGSHELAIGLAVVLALISTLALPLTADLILPGPERAAVPPAQLFGLVVYQFVPLVLGFIVAAIAPAAAPKLSRIVGPITMIALVALLALLVPLIVKSARSRSWSAVLRDFSMERVSR